MTDKESSSPKKLRGWLLASIVVISGLSFFYSDEIGSWLGVEGVLVQLGLLILTFTVLPGFFILFAAVTVAYGWFSIQ